MIKWVRVDEIGRANRYLKCSPCQRESFIAKQANCSMAVFIVVSGI